MKKEKRSGAEVETAVAAPASVAKSTNLAVYGVSTDNSRAGSGSGSGRRTVAVAVKRNSRAGHIAELLSC
jgi:uncharacterized protein YbcC (UPF0753/DUF2309 family)